MNKIVIKEDFAFLYLNKSFYDKKLLFSTIEIYKDFLKIKISNTYKYNILKINKINNDYSLEILCNEFLNYMLSSNLNRGDLI